MLITGSSDGIGLHTAKELAKLGATVLVHGRCLPVVNSVTWHDLISAHGHGDSQRSQRGSSVVMSWLARAL